MGRKGGAVPDDKRSMRVRLVVAQTLITRAKE